MEFGICSLTIVKFKRRSNEETKNQVFGNILSLLVCPFGLAGGWSLEVPDIGGLFRVVCIGGGCIAAIGHPTNDGRLRIYKRKMIRDFILIFANRFKNNCETI